MSIISHKNKRCRKLTRFLGSPPCLDLIPHPLDSVRRRAHKHDARIDALLSEVASLREEPITRVDRINLVLLWMKFSTIKATISYEIFIKCIVHGSKNQNYTKDLTHFGARFSNKQVPTFRATSMGRDHALVA